MATLAEFRLVLTEKSVNRKALPATQELSERVFTGLKRIAKDTVPLKLCIFVPEEDWNNTENYKSVIRKVEETVGIRTPVRPVIEESEIDIDDELIDALALYVMAGLERQNAKTFMGMYREEIGMNNDRLIETELVGSSNEDEYNGAWV